MFVVALFCIKGCIWLSLSNEEVEVLKPVIPLLEQIVWPLFILMLVFVFKNEVKGILRASIRFIWKSYYRNSSEQLVLMPDKDTTPITSGKKSSATESVTLNNPNHSVEQKHPANVDKILHILGIEYGVPVYKNVKVLNTLWSADGYFSFLKQHFFVAVLPYVYKDRVDAILLRMANVFQNLKETNIVFMLYVYGARDLAFLQEIRSKCCEKIVLRVENIHLEDKDERLDK